MGKSKNRKNEYSDGFYYSRVKRAGKTIGDLRMEYNAMLSQYQMYFNAVILVISLSIGISYYIITGTDSFNQSNIAALIAIGSTAVGSIIGMTYCFYDAGSKKIDAKYLKKYAINRMEEMTDEKRFFIRFRSMYIALLQVTKKKQSISIIFRVCTFLFVMGFIFYIVDSQTGIPFELAIVFLYVLPICYIIWSSITTKASLNQIGETKKEFYDSVCNLFYEEEFENFEETVVFILQIVRGREYSKRSIDAIMKRFEEKPTEDTLRKKLSQFFLRKKTEEYPIERKSKR